MLLVWIVDDERWMLDVDVDFGGTNAPIHPTSNKHNNNTTQHKQQQQHPTQTTPHTQQPPQRGLEAPPIKGTPSRLSFLVFGWVCNCTPTRNTPAVTAEKNIGGSRTTTAITFIGLGWVRRRNDRLPTY